MVRRRFVWRESFERRTVHEKQIEPAVAIEIDEGHAGACGFEKVFVGRGSAEYRHMIEARLTRDIREREANRRERFLREPDAWHSGDPGSHESFDNRRIIAEEKNSMGLVEQAREWIRSR